jgi:hypothetical protein
MEIVHHASINSGSNHDKWVLVTTAWCVLVLQMEEWPPIWTVAENILNKQLRTANKGCPPAWGLGKVLTTHRRNWSCYETEIIFLGLGLLLWYNLSNGKRT